MGEEIGMGVGGWGDWDGGGGGVRGFGMGVGGVSCPLIPTFLKSVHIDNCLFE